MKIAFWGNALQKNNVSAHLAAISMVTATCSPYKIIAFENHLCKPDLGTIYHGKQSNLIVREAGCNYYEGVGLEGMIRQMYRSNGRGKSLSFYMTDIISNHLSYIPQNRIISRDLFDYEFNQSIGTLLNQIDSYGDLCFIDTASNSLTTKVILEEANLIVVNFSQNVSFLEEFFQQYSSLISKAVFLIGNCTSHSLLSYKRISKTYGIPWHKICIIPRNEQFQEAFVTGNVAEFIKINYICKKEDDNYPFIHAIKKATALILKELSYQDDRKASNQC